MFSKIFLSIITIKNLHTLIIDRLGFINGLVKYYLWNGLVYLARSGSSDIGEIVINNGDSEYPSKYFPKVVKPVIFDVGANIGETALHIYKKTKKLHPKIYAFEPFSQNFNLLSKNIKLNGVKNIIPVNMAISDKNGNEQIFLSGNQYDGIKLSNKNNFADLAETVTTTTLEYYCSKQKIKVIDLLKIDIEGSEYAVFNKSIRFIQENVKSIFVELHYIDVNNNPDKFKKYISKKNFYIVEEIMGRTLFIINKKFHEKI